MKLTGVLPVLHMPYRDNYDVDYSVLESEIDYAYAQGADGIVFALASELLRLDEQERRKVAELMGACNRDRGSVTISIGAETMRLAVRYAQHAEDCGASALMAIPPISTRLGSDQLRCYYGAILEAVSLPLVVQDASSYVGQAMSASFQAELWSEYGDRIMFKPESSPVGPLITEISRLTQGRARIFEGSGGSMLVENYRRGIAGTMPGVDLLDAVIAVWLALESGDEQRVYSIAPLIGSILALAVGLDGYLAIEKHLLCRRGIFKNKLIRGPVAFALDDALRAELDRLFDLMVVALASS